MKFKSIKIKNFLSYGDNEIEFDLNSKSPVLIVGSNGCGKSTALYAIIYAIYGKTNVKIDNIVNRKTKKNCKVELIFTIGKDEYCILRYRQHEQHGNKVYLFKNKKDISFKNVADTEQLIQDTVQITYDVFRSSIILSPEIYNSFLRAKNSDRLKIVENIFTLGFINEYSIILKDLRKNVLDNIEKTKVELGKIDTAIETIEGTITSYKDNALKALTAFKEEKDKNKLKLKELLEEEKVLKEIDVLKEKELIVIYNENKKINDRISEERNKKQDENSYILERDKKQSEYENLIKVDVANEKELISKFLEISNSNKDIQNKVENLNSKLRELSLIEDKSNRKEGEIKSKKKEVDTIKEHIDKCSLCGQKVSSEFNEKLIDDKNKELILLLEDIAVINDHMEKFNRTDIENEIKTLMQKIKTLPEKSKYSMEELDKISVKINALFNEIGILNYQISNSLKTNKEIDDTIKTLSENIVDSFTPKYSIDFLNTLEQDKDAIKDKIKFIEKAIEIIEEKAKSVYDKTYVSELEDKLDKTEKVLEKVNKKLDKEKEEDKHYEVMTQLLSNKDNGFKKYVIDKMIPIFNKHINFYISFFFDKEIDLSFDKELNPILKVEGSLIEIESFSSGMKTRLDLSIMFALFMMVKTFFSSTINIMFLDEVLDLHLDEYGVSGVFSIIDSLSKTNNVFIISHRDLYKDKIKNRIELEMVDEITRVVSK